MKIQEIISESVQEGIATKAIGKVASWFAKPETAQAVETLSKLWSSEMLKNAGKRLTTSTHDLSAIIGKHAKDPEVIKAARAEAAKLFKAGELAANKAAIAGGVARGIKATATGINYLTSIGVSAKSVYTYNQRVAELERKLAAGEITPDEFNDARNREMSVLIGTLAMSVGAWAGIKAVSKGSNWLLGGLLEKAFGPVMSGLSAAGYAVMGNWLTTEEGRQFVAMFFASEYLNLDISPLVGGSGTYLVDKFKSLVPGWEQSGGKAAADAKTRATASGQAAAPSGTTTSAPSKAYTPAGYDVTTEPANPATGEPGRTNVMRTGSPFSL